MTTAQDPEFLVIEDNKFDQKRIERLVGKTMRVRMDCVETLSDAWEALKKSKYDLVISNNALPDGLGISFVRRLRRSSELKDVPVMMLADSPSMLLKDRAGLAGVRLMVRKSKLRPSHFQEALGTVLESS